MPEEGTNWDWNAPLLITGCARSGTSALAQALSTHRKFCIFNEYQLYVHRPDAFGTWPHVQRMKHDNHPPKKVSSDLAQLNSRMLRELPPASNQSTINWLFGLIETPPSVYGDKMPFQYLRRIHKVVKEYPEAKFLITIRDGRAVVASQIRQYHLAIEKGDTPAPWMNPTVREAEYLWLRSAKTWLQLRSRPPVPCLEVRYEKAVQSPQQLAKSICNFTGIKYQAAEFADFLGTYRAVHVDTWREELENIEDQLSDEFRDALRQLGYE
ncbi:sulfotransferase [Gammaproteobacteria bacterium]|nr:sulfotransferase [Gammaproteobacteria bacterium]